MRKRESEIEAKLRKGITNLGGRSYKWVCPGQAGVPDRIIILPPGFIWFVELKTDGGRLSPIQEYQQEILRKLGMATRTVWNEQDAELFLNDIRDLLDRYTVREDELE